MTSPWCLSLSVHQEIRRHRVILARSKSGSCYKFHIFQAQRLQRFLETYGNKPTEEWWWFTVTFLVVFWRIFVANSRKTQWLQWLCSSFFTMISLSSRCLDPPSTPNNGQSTESVNIFRWLRLGHQNACLFWENDDQLGIGWYWGTNHHTDRHQPMACTYLFPRQWGSSISGWDGIV